MDELSSHIGETIQVVAECPVCGREVRLGSNGIAVILEPHGRQNDLDLRCEASGAEVAVDRTKPVKFAEGWIEGPDNCTQEDDHDEAQ